LREFLLQYFFEAQVFWGAVLEFNTGVDVFRVFSKDDHVHVLRMFNRRRHAVEIAHRPLADIQV